ncbi:MAG: hypothetical protein ABI830_03640 [Pseudolabrys sp.]
MPEYRVFQFKSGHLGGPASVIDAPTDQEAVAKAKQMVDSHDLELWEAARLVAKIKSKE